MGYGSLSVDDRAEEAYANSKAHGFWDGLDLRKPEVFAMKIALIHSEASEALEAARENQFKRYTRHDGKPEGVMSELVDIVIRVFDLAEALREAGLCDRSLEQELRDKQAFNESRPVMHGKTM